MFQNTVSITGNVSRDPELRTTESGKSALTLGIGFNRSKMVDGKRVSGDGEFFNVVIWEELAEHVAASVSVGTRVNVTGALRQRSWTPEGETKARSVVEIVAEEVGIDLRFQTCEVTKTSTSNGNGTREDDAPPPEEPF